MNHALVRPAERLPADVRRTDAETVRAALVPLLAHAEQAVRLRALDGLAPYLNEAVRLVLRGIAVVDPDDTVRRRARALLDRAP